MWPIVYYVCVSGSIGQIHTVYCGGTSFTCKMLLTDKVRAGECDWLLRLGQLYLPFSLHHKQVTEGRCVPVEEL